MTQEEHTYIAIDLKSFYASVECVDRGLDPLATNLVVADASRTAKTICLAVSPSLKAYGIPGRARLFEVVQRMKEVNHDRARRLDALKNAKQRSHLPEEPFPENSVSAGEPNKKPACFSKEPFPGASVLASELNADPARHSEESPSGASVSAGEPNKKPACFSREPFPGASVLASELNADPARHSEESPFSGTSVFAKELSKDPMLEADYIIAVPRMAHYIEYSTKIYEIYLRYIAPEDIHVYSIDEVMMDVTKYLPLYKKTAHELAMEMIRAVLKETGITATAGIGPNLYLCKIAMDIEAKHTAPDADGVRIAELDEMSYRRKLWGHRPITDFWRVGRGIAKKLARYGIFTMGDIARCSVQDEELLYKLLGINAELLIDHAWGWEPCTIDYIKAYKPRNRSFSAGQVLQYAYDIEKARIVVREMADSAALSLVEKRLLTDQMVLTVVYDNDNLSDPAIREKYKGPVKEDRYGRSAPKPAHGTANLGRYTSSSGLITDAVLGLYDRIVNPDLLVRRIYLGTNHIVDEDPEKAAKAAHTGTFEKSGSTGSAAASGRSVKTDPKRNRGSLSERTSGNSSGPGGSGPAAGFPGSVKRKSSAVETVPRTQDEEGNWEQLDLFTDYEALEREREKEQAALDKERRLQEAMLSIRRKYGKNAILKGTNLQEGATMRERNQSIGGHKA